MDKCILRRDIHGERTLSKKIKEGNKNLEFFFFFLFFPFDWSVTTKTGATQILTVCGRRDRTYVQHIQSITDMESKRRVYTLLLLGCATEHTLLLYRSC